jgi:uncharacterized protein (UPF0216 family)
MISKISEELLDQLTVILAENPQLEIPIIVTLHSGTDASILIENGMAIQQIIESISVVSGTLTASDIESLSELDQVELIEYDGTVYALDEDDLSSQ